MKKITVKYCVVCPYYDMDCHCEEDLLNRHIDDSSVIPEWCPLEDA